MLAFGCMCLLSWQLATCDPASLSGYRLPSRVHYLALAPNTVRADLTYNVIVTLYESPYEHMQVKATLSADGEEYASGDVVFLHATTKTIQVKVPETINPGTHKLMVEGIVKNQPVFQNETLLRYHGKRVSLFIQTDKPVYYAESAVLFRIVGTTPDMKPLHGPMTVYVKDGKGLTVRRWLQKQLNFGLYEDSFEIPYPVNTGNWSILVDGFGHIYEQKFLVKFWYLRRFDVTVNAPLKIFTSEWALAGTVLAEHTSNKPIKGNGTLLLTARNSDGSPVAGNLTYDINYMSGVAPFHFTMDNIVSTFGDLQNKVIHIEAWIYDFFWMERHNGSSVTEVYKDGLRLKALGKRYRSFKPDSQYTVYFTLERTDGSPYVGFFNRQIVVQRNHEGEPNDIIAEDKLVIPDDNVVRYSFLPQENDKKITVTAWHVQTGSEVEVEFYRYWSEQGRFISVTTSTVDLRVEEYAVFTVRTNIFVETINYLVMGQGTILLASSLTMKSVQKTFSLAVSRQMAPVARIVVYCMVDSEILADALTLHINDTRLYLADLSVNRGKDFKGDRIELLGRGIPGAFISTNGHVRDFYLRGGGTFITDEKVTADLLEYNYGDDTDLPNYQMWAVDDESWQKTVYFNNPTTGVDHNTLFNVSGLVALSDTNLTVTPESTPCNETLNLGRCLSGECFELIKKCDGFIDCPSDGFDEMACPNSPKPEARPSRMDDLHLIRKHFVDTSWVWQQSYVKPTGQSEIMVDVPNINTEFMLGAVIMHPEDGLAIVNTPIKYNLTREFWMTVEAPADAKRGEQIGIRCAVFNEWDQDIEAVLMLHGGENYRFVIVEDFGIVSSYAPRTITGDIQIMVYLEAKSSKYIHFPVLPTIGRGEVEVQISAFSVLRYEKLTITIALDFDGVINDDHFPYLIDLVNQGSIIVPDFEIPIPERFFVPGQRELVYVPGSNYITMYVWGNLVIPGFFEEPLNTDSTVGIPHDSLDGYLFEFALNLQTMQYLRTTNGLKLDVQWRILEYLKTYLAKMYAYMQSDGSFKMFRRTDSSCLWMTSIVLRHLHIAHATEWNEYLAIDRDILEAMAGWIVKQFDHYKQRFEETAEYIYDRNMDPITVDINGTAQEWHLPINAHVVITLSEANWLSGTLEVRDLAAEYIASKIPYIADPYVMSIVAYALHKANHNSRDDAYWKLKRMNRTTEFVYWSLHPVPINPTRIVERRILMQPRDDHANQAHAVLATSYALMLYLAHNEIQNSVPIMKWLQTQRSNFLQFSSTQDLLIGLQALQEFAYTETNRDFYNMEITIEGTQPRDPTWRHIAHVNSSNFAESITFTMEDAWGEIRTHAKGTGYAFMHMISFHNVEKDWQVGGPVYEPQAYHFRVVEQFGYGRNQSIVNLTACIDWNRPDISPVAGMTVLLMVVPTGYVVPRYIIEQYHHDNIPGLQRVRYRNQEVMFFFEYLTTEGVCVQIQMERWFPVANMSIPHLVNVFEYSETGVQYNTLYETFSLFHLNLCQVCGSFQCPYCPYYNSSPLLLRKSPLLLWILLTVHFLWPFL